MQTPTITVQLDLAQAAVVATALTNFVGSLNEMLNDFIALEGEGTGRTMQALDLRFEACLALQTILRSANMPPENVEQVIAMLNEGVE